MVPIRTKNILFSSILNMLNLLMCCSCFKLGKNKSLFLYSEDTRFSIFKFHANIIINDNHLSNYFVYDFVS